MTSDDYRPEVQSSSDSSTPGMDLRPVDSTMSRSCTNVRPPVVSESAFHMKSRLYDHELSKTGVDLKLSRASSANDNAPEDSELPSYTPNNQLAAPAVVSYLRIAI